MNKTDNLIEKWARDFKDISQRTYPNVQNSQKMCSSSLIIKKRNHSHREQTDGCEFGVLLGG